MTTQEFRDMALSFPGTVENPHFERKAFKVTGKRIFATLHEESNSANIMLLPQHQKVFCSMSASIYPVPNKWGENGCTTFELSKIDKHIILDGLYTAYTTVCAVKKKK